MLAAFETEVGVDRASADLEGKAQFPDTVRRAREAVVPMAPHFIPVRRLPRKTTNPGLTMPHYFTSDVGDLVREKITLTTLVTAPVPGHRKQIQKNTQACQNLTVEKMGYSTVTFSHEKNSLPVSQRLRPRNRRGPEG